MALIIATKRLGPNPTQRQVEAHLEATASTPIAPIATALGCSTPARRCVDSRGGVAATWSG